MKQKPFVEPVSGTKERNPGYIKRSPTDTSPKREPEPFTMGSDGDRETADAQEKMPSYGVPGGTLPRGAQPGRYGSSPTDIPSNKPMGDNLPYGDNKYEPGIALPDLPARVIPGSNRMDDRYPGNKNYDYGFGPPRDVQDKILEYVAYPGPDYLHNCIPLNPEISVPIERKLGEPVPYFDPSINAYGYYAGNDRDDHPEDMEPMPPGPVPDKMPYLPPSADIRLTGARSAGGETVQGSNVTYGSPVNTSADVEVIQFNDPSNFVQGPQEPVSAPYDQGPSSKSNAGKRKDASVDAQHDYPSFKPQRGR